MIQTAMALFAALPVELHLDAVIAVGMDHRALRPDHHRRLLALHGRLGMQQHAMAVDRTGAERHLAADGINPVAVERTFGNRLANGVQAAAVLLLIDGLGQRAQAQRLDHRTGNIRAEVVMRHVDHA
jgi:hypothetical protein